MSNPQPFASRESLALEAAFSADRLSTYVLECSGQLDQAVKLYQWNSAITAAFWEELGHVEIALRNTIDARLNWRHQRLGRAGTWLDDPARELTPRARADITIARNRVIQKRKPASHPQILSQLSLGFWRFLVSNAYSGSLWPDMASGFPAAPNRSRTTIEGPVSRLHEFRNRLGHHERIWSEPLVARHQDMRDLLTYISPDAASWVARTSRVSSTIALKP